MVAYWHTYIVLCLVIVVQNFKIAEITVTALIFFVEDCRLCVSIFIPVEKKKINERNVLRGLH